MKNIGSVFAKATGYELRIECAECESDDTYDCPGDCNEPLDEAKKDGWILKVADDGAIFAFCNKSCYKAYDSVMADCDTSKAGFSE